MTTTKATAWTLGVIAIIALGVWAAPRIADRASSPTTASEPAVPPADQVATAPAAGKPRATTRRAATPEPVIAEAALPKLSPQTPQLLDRLQPLLNRGANMKMASEGFRDAELFASVAHAAKNTKVPFVLIKHRVLNEGMTLDRALAELKPSVNASSEAKRARDEARSDIFSVANTGD